MNEKKRNSVLMHMKFLCLCTRKINGEKQVKTKNRSEDGERKRRTENTQWCSGLWSCSFWGLRERQCLLRHSGAFRLPSGDAGVFSMGVSPGTPALTGTEPALVSNLLDWVNTLLAFVWWRKPHHFSGVN